MERERNNGNDKDKADELPGTSAAADYAGDDTGWAGNLDDQQASVAAQEDPFGSEAEELLVQRLTEGDPNTADPQEAAVRALPPRWEIRIQTERDPVAEETKLYRSMAREVDDRYDKQE